MKMDQSLITKCKFLWRSLSDKTDYQQQEVLQKEVFPMIRSTRDDKRYSR